MAWVLRVRLPSEVCDVIAAHAVCRVIARCSICDELLLWEEPRPVLDRNARAAFAASSGGLHVVEASGGLRFAPRVHPATARPCAVAHDVLRLATETGECTAGDRLCRFVATPSGLYDNVPWVLWQSRPFTRLGGAPYCLVCTRRPRRAFDAWKSGAR